MSRGFKPLRPRPPTKFKFKSNIREELTADGTDTVYVNGTPKTPEMIQHFLDELQHPVKPLSRWEEDFLQSISLQFELKSTLSDKQFEILERIYCDRTA